MWHTRTRSRTANGQEIGCPLKPNSSSPHGGDSTASSMPGAMSLGPLASTWQIFQGHFPDVNTGEDGYISTAPVGSFSANGYGLFDMAGNVWEWTSDWYRADYYATLESSGEIATNPRGPASSFDPSEPGVQKRVQRGGSFLCTDQYCARYVAGGRGKGELDTGTNHLGFRCVREPEHK